MKSRQITAGGVPAYHTPVESQLVRYYSQAQVLAGNENPERFSLAVDAFRKAFSERPVSPSVDRPGRFIELDQQDAELTPSLRVTVVRLFEELGYPGSEIKRLLTDFGWKVKQLAEQHDRILSIGCGGGDELIFLRARYPNAHITALDFPKTSGPRDRAMNLVRCEFIAGDIGESIEKLQASEQKFDLVFSNHFIEHLYDPDRQIGAITQLLSQGGEFSAGLPLDAYPHWKLLGRKARRTDSIHVLDFNWLDPRHPWKTNELDLALTLRNTGLEDVRIYQRIHHTSRSYPISAAGCRRREKRAGLLYALVLQPPIQALKTVFGKTPPRRIVRLVFALDRRLWFGRYRVKCDTQPEVFVTAFRQ